LHSPSIVLDRGFLTLDSDVIYRQLAVFINIEITILTPITLKELDPTHAAQLPPSAKAKAIWLWPGLPPDSLLQD
jgi:hypothetical protein